MIAKVTKQQEKLLSVYQNKWLQIGLSCEPLDFNEAKKHVITVYKAAKLKPPTTFLVADSPLDGFKKVNRIK